LFTIDLQSRKNVSQQIYDNLVKLIRAGVIKPNQKLQSVRDLSEQLTVAPNTVQKAFKELERSGLVYTSPGLGTYVTPLENRKPPELNLDALRHAILELFQNGASQSQIFDAVQLIFKEVCQL